LSFHSIHGCPIESFYSQVLFDPFEKQFDLPSVPVELKEIVYVQIEHIKKAINFEAD